MRTLFRVAVSVSVLSVSLGASAGAQVALPQIDVASSRLGAGITGASTSIITADDIEHSPAQNLPDILGQQTGVQVMHLSGASGSQDMVDLRGFGAFAQSNALILVNGRRYQDFDLQGFDLSTIPLNSVDHIEITRGNSGAVLYGDGAVGGVINIVTKTGAGAGTSGRVEALVGSYGYREGRTSATTSSGPWSVSVFSNAVGSTGYRQNSKLTQENAVGSLNYNAPDWTAYLTMSGDTQRQGLPGGLQNLNTNYPITLDTPRASVTPFDWGHRQDFNVATGFTHTLTPGVDLIVDGGIRRKFQQSQFYNYFDPNTFLFNPSTATPSNYVDTVMTTSSLTPRLDISHHLFGVNNRLLTGVDFYNTQYTSDRPVQPGTPDVHRYNIQQTTAAYYAMNTMSVRPDVDLSAGGRLQRNMVNATDAYNAAVDPNAGFYASNPQAAPVNADEWQYAAHLGYEYRANSVVTLFGRMARAFRLPNADERVGAGDPFFATLPANLGLKTQTSHDAEQGVRFKLGRLDVQSSIYVMDLNNEIHFIPATLTDVNLDPTRRKGWENSATYRVSDDFRLRGGFAYTDAKFRSGPFSGNEIPLVARWTTNAGASWDIVKKYLVLDMTGRYQAGRHMDNDQANFQPLIPAEATMDIKLGGAWDRYFWSVAIENLFNRQYFDYAIASATTQGFYTAYPQPGRTFMVRAGATF